MHAIQRHDDPCDNHDGAFDTGKVPKTYRADKLFTTEVEISDGIVLFVGWNALGCETVLSHLYGDDKRELILTLNFKSLGTFLDSLRPAALGKKVKTAVRAALKAQKDG